ncbi:hypothetical protein, partial [Shewanella algae]|uniref:hypothetical protein n=1 Tax=Shewanella algae TaxID=38313 RepID=UPI00313EE012
PGGIKTGPLPADKKADPVIANSITPGPLGGSDVTGTNGSAITIRKSALGKTFLMAMSISSSAMAARPNILLPKVVSFALNGSEVGLL